MSLRNFIDAFFRSRKHCAPAIGEEKFLALLAERGWNGSVKGRFEPKTPGSIRRVIFEFTGHGGRAVVAYRPGNQVDVIGNVLGDVVPMEQTLAEVGFRKCTCKRSAEHC